MNENITLPSPSAVSKDVKQTRIPTYSSMRLTLYRMSIKSATSENLEERILKRFGENLNVHISVVLACTRSDDAIFLHRKLKGLFLSGGDLVRVTIKGLVKSSLEF